ncbi:MAG: serine/threonine protein kinase, partial [Thermoanaerobaculia bacterium]|nr:serine/threonine protein kinase [Thermoanaerobaculia bacterium]
MASSSSPPSGPGASRRFGRFEVERVLGRGGMGTVFLARDPVIGRPVAIKQIRPDPSTDTVRREELRSRFELEFRSAGTLAHPNVVTIYDVGQAQDSYFIAMEYVEGESLAERLARPPKLEPAEILDLARQIASGLDYAHSRSIVHRDVKPGNVLLTTTGHVKITDFGLAKFLSTDVTQTGTLLGTPAFMAPEQVLSRPVGPQSDQFSFAVILYLMLTGEAPFGTEHPSSILYKIVHEAAEPPRRRNRQLPAAVDEVLLRALSKQPEQRFSGCKVLVEELARALAAPQDEIEVTRTQPIGDPTLRLADLPLPPTVPIDKTVVAPTPD